MRSGYYLSLQSRCHPLLGDGASTAARNAPFSFRVDRALRSWIYATANSRTGPTTKGNDGSGTSVNVNCPLYTKPENSSPYGTTVVAGPSVTLIVVRNPPRLSPICPLTLTEPTV